MRRAALPRGAHTGLQTGRITRCNYKDEAGPSSLQAGGPGRFARQGLADFILLKKMVFGHLAKTSIGQIGKFGRRRQFK